MPVKGKRRGRGWIILFGVKFTLMLKTPVTSSLKLRPSLILLFGVAGEVMSVLTVKGKRRARGQIIFFGVWFTLVPITQVKSLLLLLPLLTLLS